MPRTLTQLEHEILDVFSAVQRGQGLAQALNERDESGHVAEWIVGRVHEVSPWIAREGYADDD
jgi:signal transduction protein with GAF and PtsI domain